MLVKEAVLGLEGFRFDPTSCSENYTVAMYCDSDPGPRLKHSLLTAKWLFIRDSAFCGRQTVDTPTLIFFVIIDPL